MVHHMGNITKVTMNLPQNVIMKLHVGQLSISGSFLCQHDDINS